jgi:hypothetical protein
VARIRIEGMITGNSNTLKMLQRHRKGEAGEGADGAHR